MIDSIAWSRLEREAARRRTTVTVALLAAFSKILAEASGQAEMLLNVTFFDREAVHPQIDRIVGDFTSLLLVGIDWCAAERFTPNLRSLQSRLFDAVSHSTVSGIEVVRMGAARRRISAPVVFTSTLGVAPGAEGASLPGDEVFSISQTPQVWLDHQVLERDGAGILIWDAVDALFAPALLDRLFSDYVDVVRRLASADETVWQSELEPSDGQVEKPKAIAPETSRYLSLYARRPARRTISSPQITFSSTSNAARVDRERRSVRRFATREIRISELETLLGRLAEDGADRARPVPRRIYASAGSLYPVQVYLSVRAGRIAGLETGSYYYAPDSHALYRVGDSALADGLAEDPAFAISLVACLPAIVPVYEEQANRFALLEAGLMTHELEVHAPACGLGLCQIGADPPPRWRDCFDVSSDHLYLHTIIGGAIHHAAIEGASREHDPADKAKDDASSQTDSGDLLQALCAIAASVLDVPVVRPNDNFFELGGNSIMAVRAGAEAGKRLGFDVTIDLLEQPTPLGWAKAILRRRAEASP
jgi:SagB-type dehydrogenase family enzyme